MFHLNLKFNPAVATSSCKINENTFYNDFWWNANGVIAVTVPLYVYPIIRVPVGFAIQETCLGVVWYDSYPIPWPFLFRVQFSQLPKL